MFATCQALLLSFGPRIPLGALKNEGGGIQMSLQCLLREAAAHLTASFVKLPSGYRNVELGLFKEYFQIS